MSLPHLNSEQVEQLHRTHELIAAEIEVAGGAIPFDHYMELALYAPGAGYYVNGSRKFGRQGDFVTAPEISPLFSQCLANQCMEILPGTDGYMLEFGAGSGVMAADILAWLDCQGVLPRRYQIMELSAELRQRQQQTLEQRVPGLVSCVEWLDRLPEAGWQGVILANELLDAMPVSRFRRIRGGWQESFITLGKEGFCEAWFPASADLVARLEALQHRLGEFGHGYVSEMNQRLAAWMQAVADVWEKGAMILIDYGYPERAYYHPGRSQGTLICHFQHRAHDDFLLLPGLQDMTAHVDFSAVAEAGIAAGMELAGYSTQSQFLLGCGLDRLLARFDADDVESYLPQVQAAKQLLLPAGMGERFQVMAFQRGMEQQFSGFSLEDRRDAL